jgi:hypothetical protein
MHIRLDSAILERYPTVEIGYLVANTKTHPKHYN